ncbi:unnamed protein product, partial [Polarella glacialis]
GGQADQALLLLDQMELFKLSPDSVSCGMAMHACERCGSWTEMLRLFGRFQIQRLNPGIAIHSSAMRACGASSMWEEVMTHLEGLKCGPQHAELDAGAYSAAISSCCLQQRWADGLELVGQMRSEGLQPDEFCYSSLIGAIQRRPPEPGG